MLMERERISRVLHDEVGQVVSAVGLQLELLRMDFESREPEIAARVAAIQHSLESALVPLRRLASELGAVPRAGSGSETGGESG
jgi:signal transduction histidine kinase